ncbi:hypothetical protein LTR17_022968 [Elasticomyces elasticus]|nr:hypothetical protein LTR17_022968 [Elasticomyces elasticus]
MPRNVFAYTPNKVSSCETSKAHGSHCLPDIEAALVSLQDSEMLHPPLPLFALHALLPSLEAMGDGKRQIGQRLWASKAYTHLVKIIVFRVDVLLVIEMLEEDSCLETYVGAMGKVVKLTSPNTKQGNGSLRGCAAAFFGPEYSLYRAAQTTPGRTATATDIPVVEVKE